MELDRAPGAPVYKVVDENEYLPSQYDEFTVIANIPIDLPNSNQIIDLSNTTENPVDNYLKNFIKNYGHLLAEEDKDDEKVEEIFKNSTPM